jgi:hypothetical protein
MCCLEMFMLYTTVLSFKPGAAGMVGDTGWPTLTIGTAVDDSLAPSGNIRRSWSCAACLLAAFLLVSIVSKTQQGNVSSWRHLA